MTSFLPNLLVYKVKHLTAGLWDTLVWVRDKEDLKITAYHEAGHSGYYAYVQVRDKEDLKITAYHEAGHVLVSYFTPDSNPVHKVEIDDIVRLID